MKEKSVIIIALSMIMLSFVASSFDNSETITGNQITGNQIVEYSECTSDLYLLSGKYVIPCESGKLNWNNQQLLPHSLK